MEPQDPHEVLGIAPGASAIEIRAAYTSILNRLKEGGLAPEAARSRLDAARAAFKKLTEISTSPGILSPQNTRTDAQSTLPFKAINRELKMNNKEHRKVTGFSGNEIYCLNKLGLNAGQLCLGNNVLALGVFKGIGAGLSDRKSV